MKRSILLIIISPPVLALTLLHSSCQPSREERVRMIFEKHKVEIAECEKLLNQGIKSVLSSGLAVAESLQKGDLPGAYGSFRQQQQDTALDRGRKCQFELRTKIDEQLKAHGLSGAPEIKKVWREYWEKGKEAK